MAIKGITPHLKGYIMKKTVKERKAAAFLVFVLLLITLFVTVVCFFVSSRNKKLEAAATAPPVAQTSEESSTENVAIASTEPESTLTETAESTVEASQTTTEAKKQAADSFNTVTIDEEAPYLTLLNLNNRLDKSYKPKNLSTIAGSSVKLDSTAAKYFEQMYNAALSEGIKLTPYSGYCSYELQNQNFNNKLAYYKSLGYLEAEAYEKAAFAVLPAGASEHNAGLAIDIVCSEERFKDTAEFKWLQNHAHEYGFILRYPENKTDITRVGYEPYHWRYVGAADAAKIKENGKCLEEYSGE